MSRFVFRFRQEQDDSEPGEQWLALFEEFWPAYERWFLCEGDAARPSYADSVSALRTHMPELMPTYERLVELAGGGDRVARCLSLYRPAPYLAGCSQALWLRDERRLVRNYDFAPDKCDGVILRTEWTTGNVVASMDSLWGALDGTNEHLAVSIAFGGRQVVGEGFAITLIARYVLDTCHSADEARRVLGRVRPHMAYTMVVLDEKGDGFTAYLAPDHDAQFTGEIASTNHQGEVEWPEYARVTQTCERQAYLKRRLADPTETLDSFVSRFLEPPLYQTEHEMGMGTLYTCVIDPRLGSMHMYWPGRPGFSANVASCPATNVTVTYGPVVT